MALNKLQLAVAVKEPEYVIRLADYIRDGKFGEQWQIVAFTQVESWRTYVEQGGKVDLLAAQSELLAEMIEELPKFPVIALVKQLGESNEEYELHQYQPLPQLLQRISEIHAKSSVHTIQPLGVLEGTTGAKVISVYSASGGTGKTALALHLVHAASSHQCRTFYLNLERWNSSEAWLEPQLHGDSQKEAKREGLSELLYGLKSQPEQAANWLIEHRVRSSLLKGDYLAPCTNLEDRMTLNEEDAAQIVKLIARSGQYDVIVVDLDSGLEELHRAVFELSNQVLWVTKQDSSFRNKQRMALRYGAQKWGEQFRQLSRKFVAVKNDTDDSIPITIGERNGLAYARVELPEIPEWQRTSQVTLLSSPLYRAAVDQLFKHLHLEGGGAVAER